MTGSAGGHLNVDVDDISAAADWVRGAAQDLHDSVESLMKEVGTLMEKWRGSAADTHQTAWNDWADAARNLSSALTDDADALRAAARTFQSVDSTSAARLHSATGGLDL
ncbi:WXG100 family type VII secretion target [Nocardia tengchongensis]|uniref:WXG100 family type VII secretion target n=1 Tax=Nocardia tengchongensis TaxID=2055889 RepID=UPI0036B9188E